jgi:hypothetical protein
MNQRPFFVTALALLSISIFPIILFASTSNAQSLSGQGIAAKGSGSYARAFEAISEATIETSSNGSRDVLISVSKFNQLCGDSDSLDQVEWSASDRGVVTAIFTCVDFFGSEKPNEGTTFTFALDQRYGNLILAKQFDFKREVAAGNKSRIVMIQTAAFFGSAAAAVGVAAKVFPGETDKKLHAGTSAGMAAAIASVARHYFGLSKNMSMLAGGLGSCTIGAAKESADPYIHGHRSRDDMKADIIGCILGAVGARIAFEFE